jgi:glutaredoxin 3
MSKQVLVYSTPTCPYCRMVKEFLHQNNIEFVNFDVSTDREKAREMISKTGQMGVPVIDIDGVLVIGFDKARLSEILGL